jgi:hypothetical protein
MKQYLLIFVVILATSCNPPDSYECFGEYYDYSLYIRIQNRSGINLLNEEVTNHIDIDSVNLYRVSKDGCEILLYNEGADISKGFRVIGEGDYAIIQLLLNGNGLGMLHRHGNMEVIDKIEDTCTLLLKWNNKDNDTDTIFTTFVSTEATKKNPLPADYCTLDVYDKVYLNGNLIVSSWEDNKEKMSQGIYPVIVK